jgi:hypothetical protein
VTEDEREREEAIEDEAHRLNELHDEDFYPLSKMRG